MNVTDYIRTSYMVEVAGVQTSQNQVWQVAGIGSLSLEEQLLLLAQAWWDARKTLLGTNCFFSCLRYSNLSQSEQLIVYPALTGIGGGPDIHPQYQVVRINTYTDYEALRSKVLRGGTNISGVIESLSTRGRINDLAEFEAARQFEVAAYDASSTGLTLVPQLRWYDDGPVPPIYRYTPITHAVTNPTFLTLRSRKTSICGAS